MTNNKIKNMYLQTNVLNMVLIVLGIYFLWMDFALFNMLSHYPPSLTSSSISKHYSPLSPITIKLLLQSPSNNYIDAPLSYATLYLTKIADYVHADAVSIFSIFVAALASKFMANLGSLKTRQIGVLVYKVRDYLDAVDGDIARNHRRESRVIPNPSSWGYYFDGICDGFGVLFLISAVGFYIYNERKRYFHPQTSKLKFLLHHIFLILLQILLSSMTWNYFMFKYHILLESDVIVGNSKVRETAYGCTSFWVVIYLWRLLNPHSLSQYVLISVLYNKEDKYWSFMRINGFIALGLLTFCSELNYKYLIYVLTNN